MVRPSSNYNSESYGQRGFKLLDEGNHRVRIIDAVENFDKNSNPRWELNCVSIDPEYADEEHPMKVWLDLDGCVNALFDAAEADPASANPEVDYQPQMFKGKVIWVEVFHKNVPSRKSGRMLTFANIRRLYPAFSKKRESQDAPKEDPSNSPPPEDDFGDDFGDDQANTPINPDDVPF